MKTYRDMVTGYEIRQYTFGPERNAKLYFSTENFSADDKYFFFTKTSVNEAGEVDHVRAQYFRDGLYRANVETGEIMQLADEQHYSFAMHYNENYGVIARKDGMVLRIDIETGEMTELGRLPEGAKLQGHLTISNDGRIASSVQLQNKIYALVILDPGKDKFEIVHMTDQWIGHTQICPSDSNQIFYIHETGGDALQRTWMFDVEYRMKRPYYVEHPNEWITHETWTADGQNMIFMRCPHDIIYADKDGRHFDVIYHASEELLAHHPGISRDKQWVCTDTPFRDGAGDHSAVRLVNPRTGASIKLAQTHASKTGADHLHPSFNRAGDKILFSNPDENGIAQVCVIDLKQVERP